MKTQPLEHDHQHLLALCQQVKASCKEIISSDCIISILSQFKQFVADLDAHLICEDKFLYPYLMQFKDTQAGQLARHFKQVMGGLYQEVEAYFQKWDFDTADNNRIDFISKLCDLIGTIRTRINKEKTIVFPLISTKA